MKMNNCSKCGSENVSLDLELNKKLKGNLKKFGCADCDNYFITDLFVSDIAMLMAWNRKNPYVEAQDDVNHPSHYQSENGIECIDAIVAALGIEGAIAYCRGNVIKYSWRTDKKNGAQDLRKAEWYSRKAAELMGEKE